MIRLRVCDLFARFLKDVLVNDKVTGDRSFCLDKFADIWSISRDKERLFDDLTVLTYRKDMVRTINLLSFFKKLF